MNVPKEWTHKSMQIIYHGISNPHPLFPIYVMYSEKPFYREAILFYETTDKDWKVKVVFFAFVNQMPNTVCYTIRANEENDSFFRTKLSFLSKDNITSELAAKETDSNVEKASFSSKSSETQKLQQDIFFAYPISITNTTKYDVDVDKEEDTQLEDEYYCSTTSNKSDLPNLCNLRRIFSFYAFEGIKINVLECRETFTYRFVTGFSWNEALLNNNDDDDNPSDDLTNWHCIFSFVTFRNNIIATGTNEFFIQERTTTNPFCHKSRISMEKSSNWKIVTSFFAWDVPMPGASKYSLQYKSPDSRRFSYDRTEQSRIYTSDAWGEWNHKLYFYAYPAAVCQL